MVARADPAERFRALGIGYVRFALAHPSYLRVMFGSEVPDKAEHPALKEAGERTFALLVQAITECQAAGQVRGGAPGELAVAASSIVHGLAALLVDGKLKERGDRRGGGATGARDHGSLHARPGPRS